MGGIGFASSVEIIICFLQSCPVLSTKVCVAVMSVEKMPVFVLCVEGGVLVSVHLPRTTAGNLVAISDQHPTRHRAWWKTGRLWTRLQLQSFYGTNQSIRLSRTIRITNLEPPHNFTPKLALSPEQLDFLHFIESKLTIAHSLHNSH